MPHPDFLILGAAKSGTTALFQYFSQLPGIFLSEPKEPHYLAFGDKPATFTGPGDAETINAKTISSRGAYDDLFRNAPAGAMRGEGSVSSLYYADEATRRIAEICPAARMIFMLRNPADRAWSAYSFLRSRMYEPHDDIAPALEDEERRIADGWHHMWHYKAMSRYGEQLQVFYDNFGADQLKCVVYEDFKIRPLEIVSECLDFIGVDKATEAISYTPSPHVSGEPRSKLLSSMLNRDHAIKRYVKPFIPEGLRAETRRRLTKVAVTRNAMPARVRGTLLDELTDDIRLTSELTGVDLERWWL